MGSWREFSVPCWGLPSFRIERSAEPKYKIEARARGKDAQRGRRTHGQCGSLCPRQLLEAQAAALLAISVQDRLTAAWSEACSTDAAAVV